MVHMLAGVLTGRYRQAAPSGRAFGRLRPKVTWRRAEWLWMGGAAGETVKKQASAALSAVVLSAG
jgi:hypothetical protein